MNELVDKVPRVDIPGDWVNFVIESPRPHYIEPLFTRDPAQLKDFGRGLAVHTKTDGVDSFMLARYGALLKPVA